MNIAAVIPIADRPSLHDEIVGKVRSMILEGRLAPGAAVLEVELCRELRVSRTPLREALKVLAAEELLTLLPNRGSIVRAIDPAEIEDIFAVMEALEGLVGRLTATRASEAQIAELETMHRQLVAHKSSGNKSGYFDINLAIHRRIVELSGNRTLLADYVTHSNKIQRARYLANQTNARWSESVKEHATFMDALRRRDVEAFAGLLQEHMRSTAAAVVAALKKRPDARLVRRRAAPAVAKVRKSAPSRKLPTATRR